jgi:hypothetical protein
LRKFGFEYKIIIVASIQLYKKQKR